MSFSLENLYFPRLTLLSLSSTLFLQCYGVVPKGLLTFLGVLGNVEFSPWKRLPEFIELQKS